MDRRRRGREAPPLTEYTRPATWEDVKKVARYLEEAGVEYALVGGYALGAHGFNRFTEDIDILVNPSAENSRRWIFALSINDEFTVDVMPSIAGLAWDEMKTHVTAMTVDGVPIRLLDLPGLLKTKQGARPKDQMDAAVISAALKRLDESK